MSITDYGNIVYRHSQEKSLQKLESLYNHVMRFTGVDKMGRVKITRLAISIRQVKSAGYHCFIILQMEKPWSNWITHLLKNPVNCYNLKIDYKETIYIQQQVKRKKAAFLTWHQRYHKSWGFSLPPYISNQFHQPPWRMVKDGENFANRAGRVFLCSGAVVWLSVELLGCIVHNKK